MLVELSPAAWLALRALVEDALAESSDATPLLKRTLKELMQATSDTPVMGMGVAVNSDKQWN